MFSATDAVGALKERKIAKRIPTVDLMLFDSLLIRLIEMYCAATKLPVPVLVCLSDIGDFGCKSWVPE